MKIFITRIVPTILVSIWIANLINSHSKTTSFETVEYIVVFFAFVGAITNNLRLNAMTAVYMLSSLLINYLKFNNIIEMPLLSGNSAVFFDIASQLTEYNLRVYTIHNREIRILGFAESVYTLNLFYSAYFSFISLMEHRKLKNKISQEKIEPYM